MAIDKQFRRIRIKRRIRKIVKGTSESPRLTVFRSNKQIYAQIIDDGNSKTLVSASTLSKEIVDELANAKTNIEKSKIVGNLIAKNAVEKKIEKVVFDRGINKYHGRVKAIADGAREAGLKF